MTNKKVTTQRYFVVDAATGEVTRHASSMQAYTNEEYESLLIECGFRNVHFYPSLAGEAGEARDWLCAITAQK